MDGPRVAPVDVAGVYVETRGRLLALAAGLADERADAAVPALPGWTVKDTYAHLTGGCADFLAGRMEGAGSPAWTAKQVDDRAHLGLAEVCAEWSDRGPELDEWLLAKGQSAATFVAFDVWTHEQDVLGAVGLSGERDDDRLHYLVGTALAVFDRRFTEAGAPALCIKAESTELVLGKGKPSATVRASDYELLRILFGRRSLRQVEGADWDGEPAPYVEHLHLFELPHADLVD
jgi:uncharacterized protein (TIGR03083 family)